MEAGTFVQQTGFEVKPSEGKRARLTLLPGMLLLTLATRRGQKKVYLLAGREMDEGMWLVHRLHVCIGDPSSLHPGRSQGHRADKARPSLITMVPVL